MLARDILHSKLFFLFPFIFNASGESTKSAKGCPNLVIKGSTSSSSSSNTIDLTLLIFDTCAIVIDEPIARSILCS